MFTLLMMSQGYIKVAIFCLLMLFLTCYNIPKYILEVPIVIAGILIYWWLVESQYSCCFFQFAPKMWECGRNVWMIFYKPWSEVLSS